MQTTPAEIGETLTKQITLSFQVLLNKQTHQIQLGSRWFCPNREKTCLICIHNFNDCCLPLPRVGMEEKLANHVKAASHIGSGDEQNFGIGSSFRRSSEPFREMPLLTELLVIESSFCFRISGQWVLASRLIMLSI
ncbi:hypothetical protein CEXT_789401 [Caerostris extrusa]|uniref:Uncharacterized protein n=1 Tax=Caerostris extrusa TaxID=172846 RepID=A0AAV4XL30_CAEEX|nr:hypothetical protein CEXT_789401 [Caerostris extrusa]